MQPCLTDQRFIRNRVMKNLFTPVRKAYYRAVGHYPVTIDGMRFKLDPYHSKFWKQLEQGHWEPHTFKVLTNFLHADSVYFDIGAWIGPTVIYAARKCKKVVCFEPDPVAYRYLRWNIELNDLRNVTSFSLALSDQPAIQQISSFRGELGDSMSSLISDSSGKQAVDVITLTWDGFLDFYGPQPIDFLKIDIEGGEFALLPAMRDYLAANKPIVYLSTHAPFLDPESRKDKMQQIIDVMSIYSKCFDQDLQPVDVTDLATEDAAKHFRSYVFTD